MFKKILALIIVSATITTSAMAAGDEENFVLNVGISFPQIFNLNPSRKEYKVHTSSYGDEPVKNERYSSVGINLGARGQFPGIKLGLYADMDFYWPFKFVRSTEHSVTEYALRKEGAALWGFDGTLGVYTPIIKFGAFALPIGVGFHMNYTKYSIPSSIPGINENDKGTNFSLGLSAFANAEFSFGAFTLYAGVRFAWDFYTIATIEWLRLAPSEENDGKTIERSSSAKSSIFLTPALGIALKF